MNIGEIGYVCCDCASALFCASDPVKGITSGITFTNGSGDGHFFIKELKSMDMDTEDKWDWENNAYEVGYIIGEIEALDYDCPTINPKNKQLLPMENSLQLSRYPGIYKIYCYEGDIYFTEIIKEELIEDLEETKIPFLVFEKNNTIFINTDDCFVSYGDFDNINLVRYDKGHDKFSVKNLNTIDQVRNIYFIKQQELSITFQYDKYDPDDSKKLPLQKIRDEETLIPFSTLITKEERQEKIIKEILEEYNLYGRNCDEMEFDDEIQVVSVDFESPKLPGLVLTLRLNSLNDVDNLTDENIKNHYINDMKMLMDDFDFEEKSDFLEQQTDYRCWEIFGEVEYKNTIKSDIKYCLQNGLDLNNPEELQEFGFDENSIENMNAVINIYQENEEAYFEMKEIIDSIQVLDKEEDYDM